jgi:hypothetical protein
MSSHTSHVTLHTSHVTRHTSTIVPQEHFGGYFQSRKVTCDVRRVMCDVCNM